MEFTTLLKERRSTRKYLPDKPVTRDIVRELVAAAIEAPSWKNSQTHRYYAVLSPETCAAFREKCLPEFNAKNTENAAYIVTAFVKNRSGFSRDGKPDNEAGQGWGFYDLGLASGNLILRARDLGLDTLIMGIRDEAAIRSFLHIPEDQIIVSVIAVGYGCDPHDKPHRKSPDDITAFTD